MTETFEQHEKRNKLTAPENNYKRYNVEIIDAYSALHPLSLSKLSIVLFNAIMDTKIYGGDDPNEHNRIYNNQYITLENLLNRCHPVKYIVDKKPMSNDLSNLRNRIQELDDNNIFHIWKFGKPFSYMFIIERDVGVWEYFNPGARVPPKTLKKIVACSKGMIETMIEFEKERNRFVRKREVEYSFACKFLPYVFDKMDKDIAGCLPQWNGIGVIRDYFNKLNDTLDGLGDYDGLQENSVLYQRLPTHLVSKIENGIGGDEKMNVDRLTKELVPDNEDIVQEKRSGKIKNKKKSFSGGRVLPEKTTFKSIDPFSNCNQMLKYYREIVRSHNASAKFHPPSVERIFAAQVMDVLIKHGKDGDKDFLRSWIQYYVGSHLHGNNIYNPGKTSLSNFKKTFEAYEGKYFRG